MNLHKSKLQTGPTQKKSLAFGNDSLAHLHLFHFICHSLSHPQCSYTTCKQTLPLPSFKTASPSPTVRRYKFDNQALPLASFKTQGPCISQGIFLHIIPHNAVAAAAATSLPIKHFHWQVSIHVSHAEIFQAGLVLALPPRWSDSRCCSRPVHAAGGAAALGLHALTLPALCSDMNQLVLKFRYVCAQLPLNYVIKASFASEHHAGGESAGRAVADVARVKLRLTATNSTELRLERRRRLHRRRRPPPRLQTS